MNQQNDRVIKVKQVFHYIRRYIVFVIICGICGAVGLAGLCYLKNKRAVDAEEVAQTPMKLEDMYEEFSESERADVSYALYSHDRVQNMEQYMGESLYMQIDPYHVNQTTYQVQIKLTNEPETVEERTELQNQILTAYSSYIRNGGLAETVASKKALKGNYTATQIKELLDISYDSALSTNGGFCLYIYGADLVSGLDQLAYDTLAEYVDVLKNVAKHELVLVDTESVVVRSDTIYNNQRYVYTERVNSNDRLKSAIAALSGNTLTYYNEIVKEEEEKIETTANTVLHPQVDKKKLVKYGIVGGILGVAGAMVLLLFCFMYSKYIVADTDYTLTMGIKLLGHISETDLEKQMGFVIAKILAVCKKKQITKVALVSSDMSKISEDVRLHLIKMLEEQGVKLIMVPDVTTDSNSMAELFAMGNAIMIEKTGVSLYQKVYDMTDLCIENEVSLLGVVDIQR